jgi:hypothetical protein
MGRYRGCALGPRRGGLGWRVDLPLYLADLAVEAVDQRQQAVKGAGARLTQIELSEELAPAPAEEVGVLFATPCVARIACTVSSYGGASALTVRREVAVSRPS